MERPIERASRPLGALRVAVAGVGIALVLVILAGAVWGAYVLLRVILLNVGPGPRSRVLCEVALGSGPRVSLCAEEGADVAMLYLRTTGTTGQSAFYPVWVGYQGGSIPVVYELRGLPHGRLVWIVERTGPWARTVASLDLESGLYGHVEYGQKIPVSSTEALRFGTLHSVEPSADVPDPNSGELLGRSQEFRGHS